MSAISRRQLLQDLLGGLLGTAGAVVLARAVLGATEAEAATPPATSVAERADRLATDIGAMSEESEFTSFVNGGFRNGGFRKGSFSNGASGGSGFRKGGFTNGGFRNGGGGGAGFRNGGFANGGGGGAGFRNGAFRNF